MALDKRENGKKNDPAKIAKTVATTSNSFRGNDCNRRITRIKFNASKYLIYRRLLKNVLYGLGSIGYKQRYLKEGASTSFNYYCLERLSIRFGKYQFD